MTSFCILNHIYSISGHSSIMFIKYPMAVLGGKSRPKLKNLKPFIKVIVFHIPLHCFLLQDSQIVQLVCKDSNQQESMVKELEHENGDTNFFLADPGNPISFISTWMLSSWSNSVKKITLNKRFTLPHSDVNPTGLSLRILCLVHLIVTKT